MKYLAKVTIVLFLFFTQITLSQHQIIPVPVSYQSSGGEFIINNDLNLAYLTENESLKKQLDLFKAALSAIGVNLSEQVADSTAVKSIKIGLNQALDTVLGDEGYQLLVEEDGIVLMANTETGIFNGLQSLKQLFPVKRLVTDEGEPTPIKIETCIIQDYPRFSWRGLMLDVSRHFFTVEEVKAYLDQMAKYKLNVFHWHLTDDEGWRIEIKTFPKLTEVGAWRAERHGSFGSYRASPKKSEKSTYGGFYTQDEIKDIIAYASERNITIVPEIDVPGHSMALLAAYPQLSTKKEFKFVNPGAKFVDWYDDDTFKMNVENTLNPADEGVYAFLDMIFGEVADLFPGEYIHMGGDESYHGYWEENEKVQAFMAKNGIKDGKELQSYFVKRVEKIISSKGKKMIGWDEILDGGLADGAAVMSWRSMQGGIEAARGGHEVVMTPKAYTYLDYTQGDYSVENKIYADLSLKKAYSFDPMPNPNLYVDVEAKYILGGQGNLWTEEVPTLTFAFYMTYPRALALAETFWSPKENKNWENFLSRTEVHIARFDQQQINISKTIYEPVVKVYKEGAKLMCALNIAFDDIEMYYTLNNTYPVLLGEKYTEPFEIPNGDLSLRTQAFRDGQPIGRLLLIHRKELEERAE